MSTSSSQETVGRGKFMRYLLSLFVLLTLVSASSIDAAVDSNGEINVVDDTTGKVPASTKVPLIITLSIDRSQAVPVTEDIQSFEVVLPTGFAVIPPDVTQIALERASVPFSVRISGRSVWMVLDTAITDTKANRIVEIEFLVSTPDVIMASARFDVWMRNPFDQAIGEFIRPGNADQKSNNNDFTLEVIPNVPPPAPSALDVQPMPSENNVQLSWEIVTELGDTGGYFVYRDGERIATVTTPTESSFLDVTVPPGSHVYSIEAYRTSLLRSVLLEQAAVTVDPDSTIPDAPRDFALELEANRVLLSWKSSLSPDVVHYRVEFLDADGQREVVTELLPEDVTESGLFETVHTKSLDAGRFVYSVFAVDEAGLEGEAIQELRRFDKPFPNPFTPLSNDPAFNQITFRTTRESDASFSVQVFDLHGTLAWEQIADTGKNEIRWDGHDDNGEMVRGGIYIYQMQLGDEVVGAGTVIVAK